MPSTTFTKRRGRPPGTSRYADSDPVLLEAVADVLVSGRCPTISAAIKSMPDGDRDQGRLRRLQRKFRATEPSLFHAARERAAEGRRKKAQARMQANVEVFGSLVLAMVEGADRVVASPGMQAALQAFDQASRSEGMRRAIELAVLVQVQHARLIAAAQEWVKTPQGRSMLAVIQDFAVWKARMSTLVIGEATRG